MKILLALLLFAATCYADFDGYHYWIEPRTKTTVSWNAVEGADGYQIEVVKMETNSSVLSYHVTLPTYKITFSTNGHYFIRERSFTWLNGIRSYGEWQTSTAIDDGLVLVDQTLVPKPWIVIVPRR